MIPAGKHAEFNLLVAEVRRSHPDWKKSEVLDEACMRRLEQLGYVRRKAA